MSHKKPFGMKIPKSVKSPTGRPSKKKKAALSGGKPVPKPVPKRKAKKAGFKKGTIPRVEKALKDAGA